MLRRAVKRIFRQKLKYSGRTVRTKTMSRVDKSSWKKVKAGKEPGVVVKTAKALDRWGRGRKEVMGDFKRRAKYLIGRAGATRREAFEAIRKNP